MKVSVSPFFPSPSQLSEKNRDHGYLSSPFFAKRSKHANVQIGNPPPPSREKRKCFPHRNKTKATPTPNTVTKPLVPAPHAVNPLAPTCPAPLVATVDAELVDPDPVDEAVLVLVSVVAAPPPEARAPPVVVELLRLAPPVATGALPAPVPLAPPTPPVGDARPRDVAPPAPGPPEGRRPVAGLLVSAGGGLSWGKREKMLAMYLCIEGAGIIVVDRNLLVRTQRRPREEE